MKTNTILISLFLLLTFSSLCLSIKPWMKVGLSPRQRAEAIFNEMTFDERLLMVHGSGGPYVGNVPVNTRLGIPALTLEDGPQGVGDGTKLITAWPSALTVLSSWDVDNMYAFAVGMGYEQRLKGTNIMLGPMVNLLRVPVDGRSFESYGEDPYLASEMVTRSIKGIQSNGIMGCVKHLVDNNQEYNRTTTSANLDERTQYELYLKAFKAAIDAGVASIMCSYNKVNNVYACENNDTLNTAVKERFGFQGFIMSDWGATHSTVMAANNGLDMQMPDASFFGQPLATAVKNGQVSSARFDDMVLRILTAMFSVGIFDEPVVGNLSVNAQSDAHVRLARRLAADANILLKNTDNILPISLSKISNIAVIGDDASLHPTAVGFGSGYVVPPYIVTPLQGIQTRVGSSAKVSYAATADVQQAVANAKAAQVAVVFVAVDSSEGHDRTTLSLGSDQDNLITAVAQAQPNTIVVIHAPGAVLMPWVNSVKGLVYAMLPGQEDGNAIADVLFADVIPGGKLPFTIPVTANQIPVSTVEQYPGVNNQAAYSEKLLIGYRWYDAKSVTPLFEFGFGLSYTTFNYYGLSITGEIMQGNATVQFVVRNSGNVVGTEVPQMYLGFPSNSGEPPRQLRGFTKLRLQPGQSQTVSLPIVPYDVSIWDVNVHNWAVARGTHMVYVGSSSRNILLQGSINV